MLALVLTCAAVAWIGLVLWVPLRSHQHHLSVLPAVVYTAGAVVCHQRPERSFHLHGSALPVCARCTGLYLSGAIGALAGWLGPGRLTRRSRLLVVICALPMALTLGVEWTGLLAPSNLERSAASLPLGGVTGWLFVRMLRAEGKSS